jgi:hypothetical protein
MTRRAPFPKAADGRATARLDDEAASIADTEA